MPCSALIIVADVHHGAAGLAASDAAFFRFLDAVPDLGDALVVNGDCFDFWFGWRRGIAPASLRVLQALGAVAARVPVHLVGGNHDRWGDGGWPARFGVQWHADFVDLAVGATRVHCRHGDDLSAASAAVRMLHAAVRQPLVHAVLQRTPPALVRATVAAAGLGLDPATDLTPEKRADDAARLAAGATRWLADHADVDWLVLGHSHAVADVALPSGQRWSNPGPFAVEQRYAVLDGRSFEPRIWTDR